jgi:hypothetical protein
MDMMKKTIKIFFVLLLIAPLFAGYVFTEYGAEPETNQVTITWITKAENNVSQFVILRSKDNRNFTEIKRVKIQGPGTRYYFVDENVSFKDISPLWYNIRAVDKNNNMKEESGPMVVHPNISDISRTWGAIKAMFR